MGIRESPLARPVGWRVGRRDSEEAPVSSSDEATAPAPTAPAPTAPAPTAETAVAAAPRPGGAAAAGGTEAPLVLERYRLRRRLGAGAFGTVWHAHDERLDRDVAVKLLARERIAGGRFEREARAAARLSHPGIVTLYEAAVDDEGAYLVSELVRGHTLDDLLTSGQLSDRDIVGVAAALCEALHHAHAQGVVHRDVKPSNVLVPEAPASPAQVAKLTDFGVARLLDSESLTATGDVLGTAAYMPPEQADGLRAGAAADLYSVALVTYEALTGVNPAASLATRRGRRIAAYLPPLRRQRRDLPASLGQAIDRALRPRPAQRGTIAELRDALLAARDRVGDNPGIVTGGWSREPDDLDEAQPFSAPATAAHELPRSDPERVWPARGLAAACAAALAAWLVTELPSGRPLLAPALLALLAAAAVLILPRLGWVALAGALCVTAISRGLPGGAILVAVGMLAPMLLAPARPTAWPLAAIAPALGVIGLAGAWPALAGRARGIATRAALGAVGWVWLVLAGAVVRPVLYLPRVAGEPGAWARSVGATAQHLLPALWSSGVLAPAVVWAAAAAILPALVRARHPALDIVRVTVWALATVVAVSAAIVAVRGSAAGAPASSALVGALGAGLLALGPLAMARWRPTRRSSALGGGLS